MQIPKQRAGIYRGIAGRDYIEFGIKVASNSTSDAARRKVTGDMETRIIALACSQLPNGHVRWAINLLTEEATLILEIHVSRSTMGRVLQ